MLSIFNILLTLFSLSFLWFIFPFLIRKIQTHHLKRKCSKDKTIALTFDDGPSDEFTLKLATFLHYNNIPATFFMLGSRAEKKSEILKQVLNLNHDIGSHSYNHNNAWLTNPVAVIKDIITGKEVISALCGKTNLFRAPYGKTTLLSLILIAYYRLNLSWWTIDPKDSLEKPLSHDQVLNKIIKDNGGVILLHDWDNYPCAHHDKYVLDLVSKIIELAKVRGFTFNKVSNL